MTNKEELFDYEKELLDKFIENGNRTKEEINKFIEIIIELREQPDKNPQLKRQRNGSE